MEVLVLYLKYVPVDMDGAVITVDKVCLNVLVEKKTYKILISVK